ncbi:hydrophobe/amphiphile efflux-3 (HAE3) family transporter [Methanopyrus kandleri]|uniref:Predicted exporter of the RND superfamily n=2 Tax=Methanopyrus kandleri TaxID=2320 RepID=Q8TWH8_METKA|nr:hydrophobe/amphiphile efflux-3 (HAE3) family transporter [Methanopyrus kandleri]AAM02269.1 Predicted exporter of the RND superfamily [Methanopyrus kandleri AV19]HII69688.1 MMPL family transporter [Methanopyrus kandleri]
MRFRTAIILSFLALTAVMAYGALHLNVEVDQTKYLPDRFESMKWQHVVERELGTSTKTLLIVIEADDVTRKPVLDYMRRIEDRLRSKPYVENVRGAPDVLRESPANFPAAVTMPGLRPLMSEMERSKEMFVSKDHKVAIIRVGLKSDADYRKVVPDVRRSLERDKPKSVKFADVTGSPAINYDFYRGFLKDLVTVTALVSAAVAAVLYVDFRRWWAPVLGLTIILSAVAWVLGIMYWLGFAPFYATVLLTVVLMLGVGIDYVIFTLTRFQEEYDIKGRAKGEAILTAVRRAGRAVLITGLTASAGFAALALSEFRMVSEIGLGIVAGILTAVALTLLVLPSLLQSIPIGRKSSEKKEESWKVLSIPVRHPVPAIVALLAITGLLGYGAAGVKPEVNIEKFLGHNLPSLKARDVLEKHMDVSHHFATIVVEARDVRDPKVVRFMEKLKRDAKRTGVAARVFGAPDVIGMEKTVERLPAPIRSALEPKVEDMEKGVISGDGKVAVIQVQLKPGDPKVQGRKILDMVRHEHPPTGVKVGVTGLPVAFAEMHEQVNEDMRRSTIASAIGVLAIPTIAFRNPIPPVFGLVAIGSGILWAIGLLGGVLRIVPSFLAMQTTICILLGIGMDYCVFLASRYREERKEHGVKEAWTHTMERAGPGVLFSGLTSAIGFLSLLLSHTGIMRNMGLYQGIGVLSTLTLVLVGFPALYVVISRVFSRGR